MGKAWYADGLCFECQQCGDCCSGAPGYVWVKPDDIRRIAEFLEQPNGWLGKEHVRRIRLSYSLNELPNGDCVFLERRNGRATCRIYPVRPVQCRTWPFWPINVKAAQNWQRLGRSCPGVNVGKHFGSDEIEQRCKTKW